MGFQGLSRELEEVMIWLQIMLWAPAATTWCTWRLCARPTVLQIYKVKALNQGRGGDGVVCVRVAF